MKNSKNLLDDLRRNPHSFGDSFSTPLTFKEEFLLNGLERDLRAKVDALLDLALAGNADIEFSSDQRKQVMELAFLQNVILRLLTERGSIDHGRDSLN